MGRFNSDYKPLDKDWWSDDQGDIMAGQTRNGVTYDKYVVARGKKDDCKEKTPDGAYHKKDIVRLLFNTKSLGMEYDIPRGDYIFDSYDTYDNTCFITTRYGMTVNVPLNKIKKVENLKYLVNRKKALEN